MPGNWKRAGGLGKKSGNSRRRGSACHDSGKGGKKWSGKSVAGVSVRAMTECRLGVKGGPEGQDEKVSNESKGGEGEEGN